MDEITLTRDLGRETPLPTADRLSPARARLMAEMSAKPPRRPARWALVGAAAAAVVAAVTVPVVLSPTATPAPPPVTPAETQDAPELVPVAAFLNQAATVAEQAPDTVPRGDQFVYVDSEGRIGDAWYSIDGEHDGLIKGTEGLPDTPIPGCVDGKMDLPNENGDVKCKPEPHYLPGLPSEPKKLAAWLREQNPGENGAEFSLNGVGKHLWALSSNYWLRPAQRAALYRSIADLDGLELVPDVKDAAGRKGTGVAWASGPGEDAQVIWIFDPKTHALLGNQDYTVQAIKLVDRVGATG